ncbi:MAG: sporulation transcriptional regulator SpoIIID [Clostridia bacterium]|nr:sporulation transcriptional regulator SpoIIID [Clostridia bacterium]
MHEYIEERIYETAAYMIEHGATVRDAAEVFKISKSTVHKDVSERLLQLNPTLAARVRLVLDQNKAERHIRGGQATCRKYRERQA